MKDNTLKFHYRLTKWSAGRAKLTQCSPISLGIFVIGAFSANAEMVVAPRDLGEAGGAWSILFYADAGAGVSDVNAIIPVIKCAHDSGLEVAVLMTKLGQQSTNGGVIADQEAPFFLSADIELGTTFPISFQTLRQDWSDKYFAYTLNGEDSIEFYEEFSASLSGGKEIYRFKIEGSNGNSSNPTVVYAPGTSSLSTENASRARIQEVLDVACAESR